MKKSSYLFPFILVTSLFFLWGFVHNLDPILIPHLRKAFRLSTFQSSLIDSAVFVAYFIMALPAGIIMRKYGYKSGIIIGLLLFAFGSFLFVPAANTHQYIFFLGALFIIACGLTILETAANPYATILGPEDTSTQRLNLAQSFNGLAATVAPLIGGKLILSGKETSEAELARMSIDAQNAYVQSEASSVKLPYIILGSVILLVAVFFYFTRLPDIKEEKEEKRSLLQAFRHRHLTWAVVAQFFYVGAQVCVSSFFILLTTKAAGINEKVAANYLGLGYGLAFMSGRFIGTFLMQYIQPAKLLAVYAAINIGLSLFAIVGEGMITVYALIGIAFFMSIMFPTIFALGIKGLGRDTKIGSSLIIMSIVGGALLPPALGYIADETNNIQNGYIVPLICFVAVLYFGLKGYKPTINHEEILSDLGTKKRSAPNPAI
ncbi:MAG: L-fucose:H+ symporter permease [Chitinophagaceae bacterium]|nr:MAG: L-fucose:H+ symporter permease [Chitinophagaceae bacterium]